MNSRLILLGVVVFVAGILLLAFLLNRVVKRIRYRDTGDLLHPPPKSPSVMLIILALLIIAVGQSFFWLSTQIEYFRQFRKDNTIGWLQVERLPDPIKTLKVTYFPFNGDSTALPNEFILSGDSWRFSGEIIKFKFANKYLRLPARAYKTIEFNSRYMERLPAKVSGTLLHENLLEGGSSAAYRLFRDSRYFKWFAEVDSFSTDFVTTDRADTFTIKLESDRSVGLLRGNSLK
jgi:hypothetical protein